MTKRAIVNIGDVFGRLRVVSITKNRKADGRSFRLGGFQCSCGNKVNKPLADVVSGNTRSCGCLRTDYITKHGYSAHGPGRKHPLYAAWGGAVQRCTNPKSQRYHRYGGRGIKMCAAWRHDAAAFIAYCIAHGWERGLSIDRIDNEGDYEPGNIRCVSMHENLKNRTITPARHKSNVKHGKRLARMQRPSWRPVRCFETGRVFASASRAARRYRRSVSSLTHAIRRQGTCAKLHWEFVNKEE